MNTQETTVTVRTFVSSVRPEISATSQYGRQAIAWADANPVAWKIVTGCKSAAFGKNASTYIGWSQGGDSPSAVIERVATLRRAALERESIWSWRARFTLRHHDDRGFKGGLFQQFDGQFVRNAIALDYTPRTLPAVIDRFIAWCASSPVKFETSEVRVEDRVVRRYDERGNEVRS